MRSSSAQRAAPQRAVVAARPNKDKHAGTIDNETRSALVT